MGDLDPLGGDVPKFRALSTLDQLRVCRFLTRGSAPKDPRLAAIVVEVAESYQRQSRFYVELIRWVPLIVVISLAFTVLPGAVDGDVEMVILCLVVVLGGVGQFVLNPATRPKNMARALRASRQVGG